MVPSRSLGGLRGATANGGVEQPRRQLLEHVCTNYHLNRRIAPAMCFSHGIDTTWRGLERPCTTTSEEGFTSVYDSTTAAPSVLLQQRRDRSNSDTHSDAVPGGRDQTTRDRASPNPRYLVQRTSGAHGTFSSVRTGVSQSTTIAAVQNPRNLSCRYPPWPSYPARVAARWHLTWAEPPRPGLKVRFLVASHDLLLARLVSPHTAPFAQPMHLPETFCC
jgi:hypothetical protein